jgi:hypothetical protein
MKPQSKLIVNIKGEPCWNTVFWFKFMLVITNCISFTKTKLQNVMLVG